jgi:hypothetical protein
MVRINSINYSISKGTSQTPLRFLSSSLLSPLPTLAFLPQMRIEKKNLPNPKARIKDKWALVALYFLIVLTVTYVIASRRRDVGGATNVEYVGDFFQTKPEPGDLLPITWREDGSAVAPNGMSNDVYLS